jgi:hypothetical protein
VDQGQDVRQRLRRRDRAQHGLDVSEEIARKGQELREMTRDLDLLKVDVDVIATVIRLRGASASTGARAEDDGDGQEAATSS